MRKQDKSLALKLPKDVAHNLKGETHKVYASLVVSPTNTDQYVIMEDFLYQSDNKMFHVVPRGYVTKAGDEKKSYWHYEPCSTPLTLPALILHDYYCSIGRCEMGEELMNEILAKHSDDIDVKVVYGKRNKKRHKKSILRTLFGE